MTATSRHARRHGELGFSLVEVVFALAMLGSVLIALSGLFALAGRQLESGREQSTALAVGRDILEEMNGWSFGWIYEGYSIPTNQFTATVDTRAPGYASKWQAPLAALQGAYAEIELASVSDAVGGPPPLGQAEAIRIRVTIFWNDGPRQRRLELATVRM